MLLPSHPRPFWVCNNQLNSAEEQDMTLKASYELNNQPTL